MVKHKVFPSQVTEQENVTAGTQPRGPGVFKQRNTFTSGFNFYLIYIRKNI